MVHRPGEDEILQDHARAVGLSDQDDFIGALEVTEDSIIAHRDFQISGMLHLQQGKIFSKLANKTEDRNVKCAYMLGAAESLFEADDLLPRTPQIVNCLARSLLNLGDLLVSKELYKEAANIVKTALSSEMRSDSQRNLKDQKGIDNEREEMEALMKAAKSRLDYVATGTLGDFGAMVKENEPRSGLSRELQEQAETRNKAVAETLWPFWAGMSVERKKGIMKISIQELKSFVEKAYGKEGREALDRGLEFAQESRKWKLWKCRSCLKEFHRPAELKKHLEKEHAPKPRLYSKEVMPQNMTPKADEVWAGKISVGEWKPVDTVAAVGMINNQLADVKEFVYVDGWSKDWPSVNDEVRRKLLERIRAVLVLLVDNKILSRSIREWVINFVVGALGVSQSSLADCSLASTPQCICFLEHHGLDQVFRYLGRFGLNRIGGIDLVLKAVDDFLGRSRVKERIHFDDTFSCLLLDRRLLKGKIKAFDNEGTVDVINSNTDHYARVSPQGNEILGWVLDCPLIDNKFEFRRLIRAHNFDLWLAVLRAIQFNCRIMGFKYDKKFGLLHYDAALRAAKVLCIREDERKKNIPEDQWKTYATILCDKCHEHVAEDAENSPETKFFLYAVRDVLEEANQPRFKHCKVGDCMTCIDERSNVDDDVVYLSLTMLQKVVSAKVPLIDSEILLFEDSRSRLLSHLAELSVFDYRSYIIQMLKFFLRKELDDARSAQVAVDLLREIDEEKKKKKKKSLLLENQMNNNKNCRNEVEDNKGTNGTSTSLNQTVELIDQENLTEKSYLEDNKSSETGALKVSDKQKETTTDDMQTMPREESWENRGISDLKRDFQPKDEESSTQLVSAPTEEATRHNSVLDMMLKALWHINVFKEEMLQCRQPVHNHNHLEDQCVPCALQDLFSFFVTKQINDVELYCYLLNDVIAALEAAQFMAGDAVDLLISVLKFLHYWKIPPSRESLVTRLFTQEEFERMSCNRCRREPNYPEQSSYGLNICANSIREFKSAFGYMKFVDILKAIRMKFQMYCDTKTGGCGKRNYVCHELTRCPAIFVTALEWEKNETREEIYATAEALDTEIDISVLYKGVNPMTNYRLVSMIGCSGEEEYSLIAYENGRWVRHDPSVMEDIGNWNSVIRFCTEREVRPEILFFEATWWPQKP